MIFALLPWLSALFLLVALTWLISFQTLQSYRRFARAAIRGKTTALPRTGPPTEIDRIFDPLEAAHPGQNGLQSLFENTEAFALRALSAAKAGRSIDLMYYIWSTDLTGWILLRALMNAADRGVRVRLLLDDVNVQGFDPAFLALNQHKSIEVRLFNPIRNRGHWLRRSYEMFLGLWRFNRRMHGKLWIVDGRLAVIGGRNIGDTYMGATATRRRISIDADVMLCGPKVAEVETLFDSYWNIGLALPILVLAPKFKVNMRRFRRRLSKRANKATAQTFIDGAIRGRDAKAVLAARLHWADNVTLLADPPDKGYGRNNRRWMANEIRKLMVSTKREFRLITPYFVPGAVGIAEFSNMAKRGVTMRVVTSALSATDVLIVHGAYSWYRRNLLSMGVHLYEYAPIAAPGHPRDVLHSKVFIIDGTQAVIGSFNFDLRSAFQNTEVALHFEQPALVAEVQAMFQDLSQPQHTYRPHLDNGTLIWDILQDGDSKSVTTEPETTAAKRWLAWLASYLPIHDYL